MSEQMTISARPSPLANWRQYITYLGFVLIFVFFSATLYDKGFLDPSNLLNILRQTAMISIMSVAMTYVLASGEIDLSIGMVAGLASLVAAVAMDAYGPFAGVAAVLAAIGVYGMLAFLVVQRTAEIGVRMALGAERAIVVRMMVAQGMWSVAAGLIVGLFGAWAATRMISGLLYDVEPHDPGTLGAESLRPRLFRQVVPQRASRGKYPRRTPA